MSFIYLGYKYSDYFRYYQQTILFLVMKCMKSKVKILLTLVFTKFVTLKLNIEKSSYTLNKFMQDKQAMVVILFASSN